jgi:hypothetical protein
MFSCMLYNNDVTIASLSDDENFLKDFWTEFNRRKIVSDISHEIPSSPWRGASFKFY